MLVSVVVPAFNQAEYLREALRSALVQTHADLEVIVVDDGSTDETRVVCESFADPRLQYIHQDNDGTKGIGARNRGILAARGEWVALLDQDDRWHPNKIERQLQAVAADETAVAIFCRVNFIDGSGNPGGQQAGDLVRGRVFHALLESNRYFAASGMFRRSVISKTGLPHAWVGLADHALWLLVSRTGSVCVVDELLADYRIHSASYQGKQLASGLYRLADDAWRTTEFQKGLLHDNCQDCRMAMRRARRANCIVYFRAIRINWQQGRFAGSMTAIARIAADLPVMLGKPWILLREVVRLPFAAFAGLLRRTMRSS